MSLKDNGKTVTVRLDPDPDRPGRLLVGIRVRSRMKDHIRKLIQLDPAKFTRPVDLMKAIGVAAASCAEQLGEDCGDHIDPSQCYRDALVEAKEAFTLYHENAEAMKRLKSDIKAPDGLAKLAEAIKRRES